MVRRVEGARLAYYMEPTGATFWDQHWKEHGGPAAYTEAQAGRLGWFERPFIQHLPKGERILEAGCGLGQHVLALRNRGYNVEGVDSARETVRTVHVHYPDLPVRVEDVANIGVPDGCYGGYISLGVVEHRQSGPEVLLYEAYRVLRKDGIAIISVPHFNILRRMKARFGMYRVNFEGLEFYQYAFRCVEFEEILRRIGFQVLERNGYDSYKGIVDEISPLRWLVSRYLFGYDVGAIVQRLLRHIPLLERGMGHMLLVVCKKR